MSDSLIGGVTAGNIDPSLAQPITDNYLKSNQFKFSIDRCPLLTYFVQSVSFPNISISEQEIPTRYATPVVIPANRADHGELSVQMLIDENLKNWLEIYEWIEEAVPLRDIGNDPSQYLSTANMLILNSAYNPVLSVEFTNVFPSSLGEIPFSSVSTMTEPVSTQVSFKYSGYVIERLT
jgi:hypothetical protein